MAKREAKTALIQTGLRLEPAVVERLRGGGLSLPNEIRDRLERTFREDELDLETRELRAAVINLAKLVRQDFGDWHASPQAHAVFAAMIAKRIAAYAPQVGDAAKEIGLGAGAPETVDAIAELRERDDRRAQSYPELERRTATGHSRIAAAMRRNRKTKEDDHG